MRKYNTKKFNSWDKSGIKPKDIPKEKFIEICNNSESMAHACSKLGLNFHTFKKYALEYRCYYPNQSGKGFTKERIPRKWNIQIWEKNENIIITRASLRKWIFKLNLLPKKCNQCGLNKWLEKDIPLELNHINGNGNDNRKNNIELLCPNCHAQTPTYRGKNVNLKYKKEIKPKNKQIILETHRKEIIENKLQTIKQTDIDFTKRGWSIKLSKILNKSPQYLLNFIKNNDYEFYSKCFKKKI